MTSERLLIDWLTTEGNYSNLWKGRKSGGKKQLQVAKDIAEYINSHSVRKERNAKQISSKIGFILDTWKMAHDFANTETGAGLRENDVASFNDAVRKKCKYYFDLLEVLADRASSKPKATSKPDDLDASSDSDTSYNFVADNSKTSDYSSNDSMNKKQKATSDLSPSTTNDNSNTAKRQLTHENEEPLRKTKRGHPPKTNNDSKASIGSKRKVPSVINLIDAETSQTMAELQKVKIKLAEARVEEINGRSEERKIKEKMTITVKRVETLKSLRDMGMSNDDILGILPELKDIINIQTRGNPSDSS